MLALNFPKYSFRFKNSENKIAVFDELRKKFVVLTPEEWVRQHVVKFLILDKNYPKNHINVEKKIKVVVECKAPHIKITQEVFDQIARYNLSLKADYLMLTNGLQHYFCKLDY